ncbi:hypothetical protein RHOSPDRAFT_33816 [Rhodotorula sp. JG-1b]|nr:hypothetical protein RHOSPDRAFT_33816 [Rhodotorula sp. JG-1b]
MRSAAFPAGPGKFSPVLTCSDQNRLLTLPRREGRAGPGEIVFTAAHDTAVVPLVRSEVCYLDLYAFDEEMALRYSSEVLAKDESDRDVYIYDGYKKDVDGRHYYHIEHCYRSGHLQSDMITDQATFEDFPLVGPSAIGAGELDIGAGLEESAFGFGGDSRLVFGTSGRSLYKRQNGTAQDDNSALDDLNRVLEAIGGSNNVLDLSSGAGGRPPRKPTLTSTGPKIVKLSTVDAQTAVVHSDSRQTPTAAFGADPFFTTPSVFVAATPSLGPAPGSLSPTPLIGTLGTATPASLSASPLTLDPSSTSPPTSQSLFVTVGGAPSPTGSVTTIVH